MVCDFCSAEDPSWLYKAEPFTHQVSTDLVISENEDWFACQHCHDLIEASNWYDLAAWSVYYSVYKRTLSGQACPPKEILIPRTVDVQRQFRGHRRDIPAIHVKEL